MRKLAGRFSRSSMHANRKPGMHIRVCVCVCVCVRARARACVLPVACVCCLLWVFVVLRASSHAIYNTFMICISYISYTYNIYHILHII